MAKAKQIVLGFDPGGKGNFGWSVGKVVDDHLCLVCAGIADDPQGALAKCKAVIDESANVLAAGIDAPLFWSMCGDRCVDKMIRKELKGSEKSKVIAVHGGRMYGTLLVNGVILAKLLSKEPALSITETHPGVLRILLAESSDKKYQDDAEKLEELLQQLANFKPESSEHERHATIAAFAAWHMDKHMDTGKAGWQDLYCNETSPIPLIDSSVSYWMPILKEGNS